MRRQAPASSQLIRHIDVTGLSAVLLVVVFLFILPVAPYHHPSYISVDLPKVKHAIVLREAQRDDVIMISVTRDGSIFFLNDKVYADELPAKIRKRVANGSERKVYINVDTRAFYGPVKDVLDEVRITGIKNIAFLCNSRYDWPHASQILQY